MLHDHVITFATPHIKLYGNVTQSRLVQVTAHQETLLPRRPAKVHEGDSKKPFVPLFKLSPD